MSADQRDGRLPDFSELLTPPQRTIFNLDVARFSGVFNEEYLPRLFEFIRSHGMPKGGFAIALSLDNDSIAWFSYDLKVENSIPLIRRPYIFAPFVPGTRERPREIPEERPVWFIEPSQMREPSNPSGKDLYSVFREGPIQ